MEGLTTDSQHMVQLFITFVTALLASSGFWIFLSQRVEKKSLTTQLLLGLAHDRIIYLAMIYIHRGYITEDEYENIHECIYKPYQKMGCNGFAKRVMDDLIKLPIRSGLRSGDESPVVPDFLSKC